MNAGNATVKMMRGVKQRSIRIGDLRRQREEFWRGRLSCQCQVIDGLPRPDGPMPQKSPDDARASVAETVLRQQIDQDAVVVAGVKSDITSRFSHCPNYIDGLISIERSHFDGYDILDIDKFAPECVREDSAAHARLQIESEHGQDLRDHANVSNQVSNRRVLQRAQAEQYCVITEISRESSFARRLSCRSNGSRNLDDSLPLHLVCREAVRDI